MSDFFLDLRPRGCRSLNRVAERMCFVEETATFQIDDASFGLVLTETGDPTLWGPYTPRRGSLVVIAGRPTFDDDEWETARSVAGTGGLAAKSIYARYERLGEAAFEGLNGNCLAIVYDRSRQRLYMVTDRCGVFPAFEVETSNGPLYCSHPDVLADAANERHRLDESSLAEFILSGSVTPPFSYYERLRAADYATVFTFDLSGDRPKPPAKRRYFDFAYRGDSAVQEDQLAGELAVALRQAVHRRTLPRLGRSAVALSGGLDSRVVLASGLDRDQLFAFSCYDQRNRELRTAEAIARSLSVRFVPLPREDDYYAHHAELGVRISGGMGTFANNHFLGVIPRLKSEGMDNLLTGCYCDYLFKGLPLNRRLTWLTRREALGPFRHEFYFDHFQASSPLAARARERRESRIPPAVQASDSPAGAFQIETLRTFPLCYEADNQQRLVPQRITGWSPPFVDRDLIEVYCRIPYYVKLNRSLFRKTALALAPGLRTIPDTNTGATADASLAREWVCSNQLRVRRKWRAVFGSAASEESWPNWRYYVPSSRTLDALWKRRNRDAMDFFRRVLGPSGLPDDIESLKRNRPFLFVGLLSLKLWFDQRVS